MLNLQDWRPAQKSFFINGWIEMFDWCLIFLYTELIKSLAACLTVSCVSVFQSYRHKSSQYRMHVFVLWMYSFTVYIFLSFQEPRLGNILHTSLMSYAQNSLLALLFIQCLLFMSPKHWTINIKLYELLYICIVISSTIVPSKSTFANSHF